MRGILAAAGYVPHWRLERSALEAFSGAPGGAGSRSVASYDEDTTTMAVEACRLLGRTDSPDVLWFATSEPAYLDKTNATAVHAALRLAPTVGAYDVGGAVRSGIGALRLALEHTGKVLVACADIRTGLVGSADERCGGDAAAAALVGDTDPAAVYLGGASLTHEVVERWRVPGDRRSRTWEERFGEAVYLPLADKAWGAALEAAGVDQADLVCVASMHARARERVARRIGAHRLVDLSDTVGAPGTAHALLLLASALEESEPGQVVALVSLADGCDVLIFRVEQATGPKLTVREQIASRAPVPYGRYLAWRGLVSPEPFNRPQPARVSSPAAERAGAWKYGLIEGGESLSGLRGTIATFTVDRLAYSPSPPVVFAVVDFDDGRRLPLELTDVDPEGLAVGDRVEMTFRRLGTADGIHNYFWKARPLRGRAA